MTNVRVFGSVATGTTKKRSDIDLLVDLGKNAGLIELVDANQSMSRLLGVKVDLVSAAQLKPRVRDQVLREAIVL
jgi:predicted nucleotidyltransferase